MDLVSESVKKTIQRYQKLFFVYFKILYKYKDNIFFSQIQTSTTQTGQRKEDCTLTLETSSKV